MPKRSRENPTSLDEEPVRETPDPTTSSLEEDESHLTKYLHVSNDGHPRRVAMRCSLPPHAQTVSFETFEEFENHYSKTHVNRCHECNKNFPSEHFLTLHIEENHDPLVEARKAKGEKTVGLASHFPETMG